MKCPFELPVYKTMTAGGYDIRDAKHQLLLCNLIKERADYIVQAINNHEKLVELLTSAKCPNSGCEGGAIPVQVGEQEWESEQCQWCDEREQALEQAEEK